MRDIKWNADGRTDGRMAFHSYNIDNTAVLSLNCIAAICV